ncbi:peptidoglycan-binding domain-containing protein [Xanthobacter sp. TB0139]|uniref:peptidoglycan-binding domain-containing protein n=1 Tax=Xanthobacter sp. TB0139 TaxID=3459178 RepID=UPI004039A4A9
MRLHHAAEPDIQLAADEERDPHHGAGRGLRFLDLCASAILVAGALAVLGNALLLQTPRTSLATAGTTGGEATSIPLPRATPEQAHGGQKDLGYLVSSTPVVDMSSVMVPVKPDETDVKGLTTPRRMSTQRISAPTTSRQQVNGQGWTARGASPAISGPVDPIPRPPANVGPARAGSGVTLPPQALPTSPRTYAVQRALARLGYGPLKVDGVEGAQTRQAIQRFQSDRRLPVTGEVDARLLQELSAVSGMRLQ